MADLFAKLYVYFFWAVVWGFLLVVLGPIMVYIYSKIAGYGWRRGANKAIEVDWERLTKEEEEREYGKEETQ
jgi:hypothetical protein